MIRKLTLVLAAAVIIGAGSTVPTDARFGGGGGMRGGGHVGVGHFGGHGLGRGHMMGRHVGARPMHAGRFARGRHVASNRVARHHFAFNRLGRRSALAGLHARRVNRFHNRFAFRHRFPFRNRIVVFNNVGFFGGVVDAGVGGSCYQLVWTVWGTRWRWVCGSGDYAYLGLSF